MKTFLASLLTALLGVVSTAQLIAQTNAFTYQGQLRDNGQPAVGSYDMVFSLHDAGSGGTQVGMSLTNTAVAVIDGLFTVTLDFGSGVFDGADRWLETQVRANGGGLFVTLSPRQLLTPSPYALFAPSAGAADTAAVVTGSVDAGQLTGTISSNNLGAGSITTDKLAAGAVTTDALADGAVTAPKIASVSNLFALTIANPAPALGDHFGFAVAGVGTDGVLVGAYDDYTDDIDAGAAYLFSTEGQLLTTFAGPEPMKNDFFGYAVAAVGTDRVLIGAYSDDTTAPNTGAAYLFSTDGTLLTTFLHPSLTVSTFFGYAVAAVGTDQVLIGAYGDWTSGYNFGAAYLFGTNGTLLTTFTNPAPAAGDSFGISVAAVGSDRVLIGADLDDAGVDGAGAAYLYSTSGSLLTVFASPSPQQLGHFGRAVTAVGTDQVLIGAYLENTVALNAGAAYLFSTNGTLLTTFTVPEPVEDAWFGRSVAAVGNDRVLIGADGNRAGHGYVGAAYLFSTDGTLLATLGNPAPAAHTGNDRFGYSIAAVGTDRLLIGAYADDTGAIDTGAAYLFSLEGFTPGLVADGVRPRAIVTESLEDGAVTAPKIGGVLYPGQIPDLDASKITSGTLADTQLPDTVARANEVWLLAGNSSTAAGTHFLGTLDDEPLELKVDGRRALRLEPSGSNSVHVIAGWEGNGVDPGVFGATIAGGGVGDYRGEAWPNQVRADAGTIGGGFGNSIETNAYDSTIGGGAWNRIEAGADRSTIAGGEENTISVEASISTIGGGHLNTISTNVNFATISGGRLNAIQLQSDSATVGGGQEHIIASEASSATISGGGHNRVYDYARASTIGGGVGNTVLSNGIFATIPGGYLNAAASYAFAAGQRAKANHPGAFVWADSTGADFATTASNQFLIRATGGVGINTTNPVAMLDVAGPIRAATLELTSLTSISNFNADLLDGLEASAFWNVGGNDGTAAGLNYLGTSDNQPLEFKVNGQRTLRLEPTGDGSDYGSTPDGAPNLIGGSPGNFVPAGVVGATIAGGGATEGDQTNSVWVDYGTIGGGKDNRVETDSIAATIAGGFRNRVGTNSDYTVIGGGWANTVEDNAFAVAIIGGIGNSIRTNAHYSVIGGGEGNNVAVSARHALISGGYQNAVGSNAQHSAIGGGAYNRILDNATDATISGGVGNRIGANGGDDPVTFSHGSSIGGGVDNEVSSGAWYGTVAGGVNNKVGTNSYLSVIGGGGYNRIAEGAWYAMIPGGERNRATDYAFAAGRQAKANHVGTFVWADSTWADFASTASNQFLIRATGGVGINTTNPTATLDVAGTVRAATIELTSSTIISNFNADLLDGLEGSAFWSIGGNTGTIAGTHFLGTADNQPLELKVNGQRALRLEPDTNGAPNVIGGAPLNLVDADIMGATIGGGGATNSFSPYIPGGQLPGINRVSAHFGTVAGGGENTIERDALGAAIGGGLYNQTASNAVVATISGGALNVVGPNANGGSIGGGYLNSIDINAYQATIGGGSNNVVESSARWATIGGGSFNQVGIGGDSGFIGGGYQNIISSGATEGTIAGGFGNRLSGNTRGTFIGGGFINSIGQAVEYSAIAGGYGNRIADSVNYAAIPGGHSNEVAASYGFAAGRRAKAYHAGSFVWADAQNADFASTTANQFGVRADGGVSIVAGGTGLNNAACRIESTAGNGVGLWVAQTSSDAAAVLANTGVGDLLKAFSPGLVYRLDNSGNVTAASFSGAGSGLTGLNASQLTSGTVPSARLSGTYSGAVNLSNPANSFTGNGSGLSSLNASQLTSGTVSDSRLSANVARLNSSPSFTGTVTAGGDLRGNGRLVVGASQSATGSYASIAGGSNNSNHGSRSAVGGGQSNGIAAGADYSAIGGGQDNTASATWAAIGGGQNNNASASADWAAIGGGQNNNAGGNWAAVGGGFDCRADNAAATVGGGYNNTASGNSATIPGGADNTASGNYSFAAGRYAQATHTASVVFSGGETTASWGDRTFTARAHGGARFYSASGTATGVQLAAGGNSWSAVSDRAVKENFTEVDPCEVLERVAALPVTTWNLKSQPKEIRHIGPMAQDFAAAFGVGEDDRHISSSDADGVALAAIQGLNQKVEEKNAEIAELKTRLTQLEQLVMRLTKTEGSDQ